VFTLLKGAGNLSPTQSSTSFNPTKFLSVTGLRDLAL
jgi:hypothetical protein